MNRILLKRILDVAQLLCAAAMIIALVGGGDFRLFGTIHISIHRFARPFVAYIGVLLLRLWISSPPGLKAGERIDFWLERVRRLIELAVVRKDGQPRKFPYTLLKIIGLRAPGTDLDWNGQRFVAVVTTLLVLFLSGVLTYRYFNCGKVFDFLIFLESMESAISGGLFENPHHFCQFNPPETIVSSSHPELTLFASHFRPIMFLLIPLYRLVPGAITLFVIQALIIGASIWPLFQLAKKFLGREDWAMVVIVCYCLYPSVVSRSISFVPGAFSICFLTWAFWFLSEKRHAMMALFLLLTLACKELMALPVMSFGAYVFFFDRKRVMGGAIAATALAWLAASFYWIIPHFNPASAYGHFYIYRHLGSSLPGILQTICLRPDKLMPYLISTPALRYLIALLFPVAFLPLLGWRVSLLCLPVIGQNLLSGPPGNIMYRDPGGLYSLPLVPFIFMSSLWGLSALKRKYGARRLRRVLAVMVITSLLGTSVVSWRRWSDQNVKDLVAHFRQIAPKGTIVTTNVPMFWCHLTNRYDFRIFPNSFNTADFAVVRYRPGRRSGLRARYLDKLKSDRRFAAV